MQNIHIKNKLDTKWEENNDKDKSIPELSIICRVIEFGLLLGQHSVPLTRAEDDDIKRFSYMFTISYGVDDEWDVPIGVMKHTHHSKLRSIPLDPMDFSAAPVELGCHACEPGSITQGLYSESVAEAQKLCQYLRWESSLYSESSYTHA